VLGAGFVDVMDGNELGMAIPVGFYKNTYTNYLHITSSNINQNSG
jgi:hypothetical protein